MRLLTCSATLSPTSPASALVCTVTGRKAWARCKALACIAAVSEADSAPQRALLLPPLLGQHLLSLSQACSVACIEAQSLLRQLRGPPGRLRWTAALVVAGVAGCSLQAGTADTAPAAVVAVAAAAAAVNVDAATAAAVAAVAASSARCAGRLAGLGLDCCVRVQALLRPASRC